MSSWLGWFVSGLVVLSVSVSGIVLVLKWGGVTPHSDPTLLLLFVGCFALLLLAYCQLMSSFFSRASTAALLSVLLYVLSFFPFLLFVTWELDFLYWQKLISCCLVSTSFCFGCLYLNRFVVPRNSCFVTLAISPSIPLLSFPYCQKLISCCLVSTAFFFVALAISPSSTILFLYYLIPLLSYSSTIFPLLAEADLVLPCLYVVLLRMPLPEPVCSAS